MKNEKVFKDPIYGYISIPSDIVSSIINTPFFQRLRNVRQTSYAPLYHTSVHNRFMHSIGVYFLATIAIRSIKNTFAQQYQQQFDEKTTKTLFDVFVKACLLHDIGHAPFSHTGEEFFLRNPQLNTKLKDAVNSESFSSYVDMNKKYAAPHEIVSVIVSLTEFSKIIPDDKKEFFARCVLGYQYNNNSLSEEEKVLNCLISLLNSPVIDVDRLDYIIRDSLAAGYKSVQIDYERLLSNVLIEKFANKCEIVYHKSSLSIIENVIYAHDFEKKWVQNHPAILYELFVVQHAIRKIEKNTRLFDLPSLQKDPVTLQDGTCVSLLADEDILYLLKNKYSDDLTAEYFDRNLRRKPLWKSEAEYVALFNNAIADKVLDALESDFKALEEFLVESFDLPFLNESVINFCYQEKDKIDSSDAKEADKNTRKESLSTILEWANTLKKLATENKMEFDFIIISANKFKSSFLRPDLENLLIRFYDNHNPYKLNEVSSILKGTPAREKFFYLYYRPKTAKLPIDCVSFSRALCAEALSISARN